MIKMDSRSTKDNLIAEAYKENAQKGFEVLYAAYYDQIFYFVLNMSSCAHESADIAQNVFIKASSQKGIENYNIKAWLYKVALNEFYRTKRSILINIKYIFKNFFRFIDSSDNNIETAAEKIINDEGKSQLREKLAQLDDNSREILILKYYNELSYNEIAEILEISAGTVMSRLSRAKAKLMELMKNEIE